MADDLDDLIADSLGGVQSALDAERRAPAAAPPSRSAAEAVRDLQQGPGDGNEELFTNLAKTFQDDGFQKAMADVLRGVDASDEVVAESSAREVGASGTVATADSSGDAGVEDFLQNFMKSFDSAVSSDGNFEKSLTTMMTSMLSNELICEPLQKIADYMEPWLKAQKSLSAGDRRRYESQLVLYKRMVGIYKSNPDPLPDSAREEVQRLLEELHQFGQPPEEVMKRLAPEDAGESGEGFEDFIKSMGLDQGLGAAEQDLLKKLAEDPEELTKVMTDMAKGMPEDGCKQQ